MNPTPESNPLRRRALFAGVGAAGALATVAAVLPGRAPDAKQAVADLDAAAKARGGYQLTDHVKQYYATARV